MRFQDYVKLREADVGQMAAQGRTGQIAKSGLKTAGGIALDAAKDLVPGANTAAALGKFAFDIWTILRSPSVDKDILGFMSQADTGRSQSQAPGLDVDDNTWNRLSPKAQQEMVATIKQGMQQLAQNKELPGDNWANEVVWGILQGKGVKIPPGVKQPQQGQPQQGQSPPSTLKQGQRGWG